MLSDQSPRNPRGIRLTCNNLSWPAAFVLAFRFACPFEILVAIFLIFIFIFVFIFPAASNPVISCSSSSIHKYLCHGKWSEWIEMGIDMGDRDGYSDGYRDGDRGISISNSISRKHLWE